MHDEDELLDRIWRAGRPRDGDPLAADRRAFIRALRARSRRSLFVIVAGALALAAATAMLTLGALRQREAAMAILLLPSWVALIAWARSQCLHQRTLPDADAPIRDALGARLDRNRRARRRVRLMALLHALSVPLWGYGVAHLASTARLAAGELPSLVAVLAGFVLGAALLLGYREFGQLRPEADRLTELLRSYGG